MSTLVAILFDTPREAQVARADFAHMQREHLVSIEDSVVVYKNEKGKVNLDQSVNLAASGAAGGGFWGLLIGMLLSIPIGGPLVPLIGAVFGAGVGALSGALADYGIDDAMMTELGNGLEGGKAALFVLVRSATLDRVLHELSKHNGEVLKTSLPFELEERLRQVLAGADRHVASTPQAAVQAQGRHTAEPELHSPAPPRTPTTGSPHEERAPDVQLRQTSPNRTDSEPMERVVEAPTVGPM